MDEKNLGNRLQVCAMGLRFFVSSVVLGVPLLALTAWLAYMLQTGAPSLQEPGEHRAATIIAWMAGAMGLFFLGNMVVYASTKLELWEKGIIIHTRGRKHVLGWDDLRSLRGKVTEHYTHGVKAATIREYWLVLRDGTKIYLPTNLNNLGAVGEKLEAGFYPAIQGRILEALKKGETVNFGKWQMSNSGLQAGKKSAGWKALGAISVKGGWIRLQNPDGSIWSQGIYGDTPNAPVFVQLVKNFRSA